MTTEQIVDYVVVAVAGVLSLGILCGLWLLVIAAYIAYRVKQ